MTGTKSEEWYDSGAVNGKFIDELVGQVKSREFDLAKSGQFSGTLNRTKFGGTYGVYRKRTGRFSWEEIRIECMVNQPSDSEMAVCYRVNAGVGSRRYFGSYGLWVGISLPSKEWTHIGKIALDGYVQCKAPNRYDPHVDAGSVLAKVGVEARL